MDPHAELFFRWTELDPASWPEFRERIVAHDQQVVVPDSMPEVPRSYPGFPHWPLDRVRERWWPPLDRTLRARRSRSTLREEPLPRKTLSRLLALGHGRHATAGRGPTPSAGGLQALELYLAQFRASWLPSGLYHYDRGHHLLSQVNGDCTEEQIRGAVPSLGTVVGGALLWILVGDAARVRSKYGPRGLRFLLLEAGHLMQSLCLLSASLGCCTVPLGAFFEEPLARALRLPATDLVLYTGVCGLI